MDTRNGHIYDTIDEARAAGVPEQFLVSGTREALEDLKKRIVMPKGRYGAFKNAPAPAKEPVEA